MKKECKKITIIKGAAVLTRGNWGVFRESDGKPMSCPQL